MGIIAWVILGLIAGLIARALYPGRQPGGVIATIVLGIIGAIVGGWIGRAVTGGTNSSGLSAGGIFWAAIGAIVVLVIFGFATGGRATHRA